MDGLSAIDAAGKSLPGFIDAEAAWITVFTSKCLVPATPVVKVNGVAVQSGTSIPFGSRISITNPNANTSGAPAGGVSVYLNIDVPGGIEAIGRDIIRQKDGSVEFVLSGEEDGLEYNFDFTYTIFDPNYVSFAGDAFRFTNYRTALGMPYVTVCGRRVESGTKLLNGTPVVIVNPNEQRESDGTASILVWPVYTEAYTNWATARPANDRTTGNSSFTVAGTPGTTHDLLVDLVVMGVAADYAKPLASEFHFSITDSLPAPIFNLDAVKRDRFTLDLGYAAGVPGVHLVRSNYTPGKATWDRQYDTEGIPGAVDGAAKTLYGAYTYGEGYVTSPVVFSRVGDVAPQDPAAPVYAVNGTEVAYAGIQHVRPGDVISARNPNWYTIGSFDRYFVADMYPVYGADWLDGTDADTYALRVPSENTGGVLSVDMEYAVKESCTGAFRDATFTKEFFVDTPLDPAYFTVGDQLLRSGMAIYNGSPISVVNPNSVPGQQVIAGILNQDLPLEDIAAPGTYTEPDDFGQQSLRLQAPHGSSYDLLAAFLITSDEYYSTDMEPVTFSVLSAPRVKNILTSDTYPSGAAIPVRSSLAVDFIYDVASHPGAEWHIDIKGQAPSAPATVPAGIMLEGSQGVSGAASASTTSFVLAAEVDEPVTLLLYVTDADGTLLTSKAEYTFTPVACRLLAPYVTVDGIRVDSGCDIDNWSTVRIVNPNGVSDAWGNHVGNIYCQVVDDSAEADLKDYAYQNEVTVKDNGEHEFTVRADDSTSVDLMLGYYLVEDVPGIEVPAAEPFTFTIRDRRLAEPVGTSRISAGKVQYSFSDPADSNVPDRVLHYAVYSDALENKTIGTAALSGTAATSVFSQASGVKGIAMAYVTGPGCLPSEPSYIYWMGQQHTLTAPRLYVHHRPLEEGAILSPGDVITVENPYNFRIGEEIPWHCPVEHAVTVDGDISTEVEYEDWSGNYHIKIPASIPARVAAPAALRRASADMPSISFTSTLTPLEAHTAAFAAGTPRTYTFAVDPEGQTGVETISADALDADTEIYTLTGVRVTTVENLAPGFYILVRGNISSKVLLQ